MEIKALSATFGRLEGETLALSPGLNVIEARNEGGKTTWMAFLRIMLYGLNTRDRSPLADKHRYLPWSGSSMQGRMDVVSDESAITITRSTKRANSPMGAFSACFTDTATPVPDLTAASLGETLLGVPQDVFERSAFIRQSGIAIDQSAALERRIAALITTGEEDSSYTDAADRLRRQLTRRRYHKSGLLPQLEIEISSLESILSEITSLEASLRESSAERDTLLEQEAYLLHQISLHDTADAARRIRQLNDARAALQSAESARVAAERSISALPSRDELSAIRSELDALDTVNGSVRSAQLHAESVAEQFRQSEQTFLSHPFAPQTPAEAERNTFTDSPRPAFPKWLNVFSSLFGAALIPLFRYGAHLSLSRSIGAALIVAGLYLTVLGLISLCRQTRWKKDTAEKRRIHQTEIEKYTIIYDNIERQRATCRSAADAHKALSADYERRLAQVLSGVCRFCPVDTLSAARRAVDEALARHTLFSQTVQTHREAQLSVDLLSENAPLITELPKEAPALPRAEVEQRLQQLKLRLSELHRTIHTVEGRCQTLGDPLLLQAELDQKRAQHETLQKEYDAISLASAVLDDANTALQSRFSPALGEKAANIFTKLTQGKYNKVLLDRKMTPSAQESGSFLPHEVITLSQGTADQLYLAVRLAICDMVLPAAHRVPIFLDDALITFDDDRMAAALDYLVELSEQRQILLFTCQQRELNYLRAAHPDRFHAVTLSREA